MESLVAIGLAGNVVQFVQFAGKLISEMKSIRRNGAPSSISDLRGLIESLTKQTDTILKSLQGSTSTLSDENKFLLELTSSTHKTGVEVLAYIDRRIGNQSSSNPFRTMEKTFKLVFSHGKIEDFTIKLDKMRNALVLSSILAFRESANVNLEDILVHLKRLEKESQNQSGDCAKMLEIVESAVGFQGNTVPKLELMHQQIQSCLDQLSSLKDTMPESREKKILQWLDFRQITWRYEEVPLAYRNTYHWIFEAHSQDNGGEWDDFMAHLSRQDVSLPYFINGKAGSGKSTLLKYIVGHQKTKDTLLQWAGNKELAIAKFFFWNVGTDLQKSTVGMLRALLYDILAQYPEMIPSVFPKMYQNWTGNIHDDESLAGAEPHITETKSALRSLIHTSERFLKLCLFVDGVDEFDGDHREISEFLRSLATHHVKVVISGRPLPICLSVFCGCPSLELQKLTGADIELYIENSLVAHGSMVSLSRHFPQETKELVTELKEKAAGVFLWVRLVVRLLMDGIDTGDDLTDLRRKLRSLPTDLRHLYRRMISKIEPGHRTQAAELFQLLHHWKQLVPEKPCRTVTMSFAIQKPSKVFSQTLQPPDKATLQWMCKNVEARIRSRCWGLIDVYTDDSISSTTSEAHGFDHWDGSVVDYHHRTVAEFLTSDNILDDIREKMHDTDFESSLNLASACVSTIKMCQAHQTGILRGEVDALLYIFRDAPAFQDNRTLVKYVDLLDTTMTQMQVRDTSEAILHWSTSLFGILAFGSFAPVLEELLFQRASILTFAAQMGLSGYLAQNYHPDGHLHNGTAMVMYVLDGWLDPEGARYANRRARVDILSYVLDNDAYLRSSTFSRSPWSFVLARIRGGWQDVDEQKYLLDYAAVIAICLIKTKVPQILIQDIPQGLDLNGMACALIREEDLVLKKLGNGLKRVCRWAEYRDRFGEKSSLDMMEKMMEDMLGDDTFLVSHDRNQTGFETGVDLHQSTFFGKEELSSKSPQRHKDSTESDPPILRWPSISFHRRTLSPASIITHYLAPFQLGPASRSRDDRQSPFSSDGSFLHSSSIREPSPERRRQSLTSLPSSSPTPVSPFRRARRIMWRSEQSRISK